MTMMRESTLAATTGRGACGSEGAHAVHFEISRSSDFTILAALADEWGQPN